jgi:hypothetical protein
MNPASTTIGTPTPTTRLWTTDSLRRAQLGYTAAAPEGHFSHPRRDHPLPLWLPFPDWDGEEIYRLIGTLSYCGWREWIAGGRPWSDRNTQNRLLDASAELYGRIVKFDWALLDNQEMQYSLAVGADQARHTQSDFERARINDKNDRVSRLSDEQLRLALDLEAEVDAMFSVVLAGGLEARAGKRLVDESEVNAYLQIRSRWLPKPSHWHVCERCDIVFKVRRAIERDSYRCGACHNKRLPRLRPAHVHRACSACGALFVPAHVRQTVCAGCRAKATARSRHPDRKPVPGTEIREAVIDLDITIAAYDPTRPPAPYWSFLRRLHGPRIQ